MSNRYNKLAQILISYSTDVQPGEKVAIMGSSIALPLIIEIYREAVRAGGHPILIWQDEVFDEVMLQEGNEEQLKYTPDELANIVTTYQVIIEVQSSKNTYTLANVQPQRQRLYFSWPPALMQTHAQRRAKGELRTVSTYFPTYAYAQDARMSLAEFEEMVYAACFLDQDDPVAVWREQSRLQKQLVKWLADKKEVHIKGPQIDLTLSVADRTFLNLDGHIMMPDGEIMTAPVEKSVDGWVHYNCPANLMGREVSGIEMRFEEGKVVEARAQRNEAFLLEMLDTDEGARYLGEFSLPQNPNITRFSRLGRLNGKMGGTIHVAVGNSWPGTGGRNKSAVHWDMYHDIRDGSQIWIDGELVYDNGKLVLEFGDNKDE